MYLRVLSYRSLSLSLSLSAASDRLLAAGEQVGSGTTTSERREGGEGGGELLGREAQRLRTPPLL